MTVWLLIRDVERRPWLAESTDVELSIIEGHQLRSSGLIRRCVGAEVELLANKHIVELVVRIELAWDVGRFHRPINQKPIAVKRSAFHN